MPPVHPAAEKFPMMPAEDLAALAADIKENGQRVPIQMIDGAILDGRNRWRACEIADIAPVTQNWAGQGSPAGYVLSINLRRRHLSPEQRAAIAAEFVDMFRQEARLRQAAAGEHGIKGKSGTPLGAETTPRGGRDESGRAMAQAAKAAGASLDSTKKIAAAAKVDPELQVMAREGQVNITEATRLAALSKPERETAKAKIKEKKGKAPATRTPRPRTQTPQPSETPEQRRVLEALRDAMTIETERRVGTYYFSLEREGRLLRLLLPAFFGRWPEEHHEELNQIIKEGHQ